MLGYTKIACIFRQLNLLSLGFCKSQPSRKMNKVLTLLIVLMIVYHSFSPVLKLLIKRRVKRKEYKLDFSKKFNHFFSATLLLCIPLLCIISYYPSLPSPLQITLVILAAAGVLFVAVCLYLYINYQRNTPYESLIYDPMQSRIELLNSNSREIISLHHVRGIEWYSISNFLKLMPWSTFEYLVLELKNGKCVKIPSLIMAPAQLHTFLQQFEVVHKKKFIPTIY
jgi:hypothetical protein